MIFTKEGFYFGESNYSQYAAISTYNYGSEAVATNSHVVLRTSDNASNNDLTVYGRMLVFKKLLDTANNYDEWAYSLGWRDKYQPLYTFDNLRPHSKYDSYNFLSAKDNVGLSQCGDNTNIILQAAGRQGYTYTLNTSGSGFNLTWTGGLELTIHVETAKYNYTPTTYVTTANENKKLDIFNKEVYFGDDLLINNGVLVGPIDVEYLYNASSSSPPSQTANGDYLNYRDENFTQSDAAKWKSTFTPSALTVTTTEDATVIYDTYTLHLNTTLDPITNFNSNGIYAFPTRFLSRVKTRLDYNIINSGNVYSQYEINDGNYYNDISGFNIATLLSTTVVHNGFDVTSSKNIVNVVSRMTDDAVFSYDIDTGNMTGHDTVDSLFYRSDFYKDFCDKLSLTLLPFSDIDYHFQTEYKVEDITSHQTVKWKLIASAWDEFSQTMTIETTGYSKLDPVTGGRIPALPGDTLSFYEFSNYGGGELMRGRVAVDYAYGDIESVIQGGQASFFAPGSTFAAGTSVITTDNCMAVIVSLIDVYDNSTDNYGHIVEANSDIHYGIPIVNPFFLNNTSSQILSKRIQLENPFYPLTQYNFTDPPVYYPAVKSNTIDISPTALQEIASDSHFRNKILHTNLIGDEKLCIARDFVHIADVTFTTVKAKHFYFTYDNNFISNKIYDSNAPEVQDWLENSYPEYENSTTVDRERKKITVIQSYWKPTIHGHYYYPFLGEIRFNDSFAQYTEYDIGPKEIYTHDTVKRSDFVDKLFQYDSVIWSSSEERRYATFVMNDSVTSDFNANTELSYSTPSNSTYIYRNMFNSTRYFDFEFRAPHFITSKVNGRTIAVGFPGYNEASVGISIPTNLDAGFDRIATDASKNVLILNNNGATINELKISSPNSASIDLDQNLYIGGYLSNNRVKMYRGIGYASLDPENYTGVPDGAAGIRPIMYCSMYWLVPEFDGLLSEEGSFYIVINGIRTEIGLYDTAEELMVKFAEYGIVLAVHGGPIAERPIGLAIDELDLAAVDYPLTFNDSVVNMTPSFNSTWSNIQRNVNNLGETILGSGSILFGATIYDNYIMPKAIKPVHKVNKINWFEDVTFDQLLTKALAISDENTVGKMEIIPTVAESWPAIIVKNSENSIYAHERNLYKINQDGIIWSKTHGYSGWVQPSEDNSTTLGNGSYVHYIPQNSLIADVKTRRNDVYFCGSSVNKCHAPQHTMQSISHAFNDIGAKNIMDMGYFGSRYFQETWTYYQTASNSSYNPTQEKRDYSPTEVSIDSLDVARDKVRLAPGVFQHQRDLTFIDNYFDVKQTKLKFIHPDNREDLGY